MYNTLGLPNELLGTLPQPTEIFNISEFANTPGGPLKGFELNAQVQFTFWDGFFGELRRPGQLHEGGIRDRLRLDQLRRRDHFVDHATTS